MTRRDICWRCVNEKEKRANDSHVNVGLYDVFRRRADGKTCPFSAIRFGFAKCDYALELTVAEERA